MSNIQVSCNAQFIYKELLLKSDIAIDSVLIFIITLESQFLVWSIRLFCNFLAIFLKQEKCVCYIILIITVTYSD